VEVEREAQKEEESVRHTKRRRSLRNAKRQSVRHAKPEH